MPWAAGCFERSAAQFKPAWADSSVSPGTVVSFGTFRIRKGSTEDTIIQPATLPYASALGGNLTEYVENNAYYYHFDDSGENEGNNLRWIKLSNTLLVADRNLLCGLSWQNIRLNTTIKETNHAKESDNSKDRIIGASESTIVTIDGHKYRIRLLTGEHSSSTSADTTEWGKLVVLTSGSDDIMHWKWCYSWCDDYSQNGNTYYYALRGFDSASCICSSAITSSFSDVSFGFRPALELIE